MYDVTSRVFVVSLRSTIDSGPGALRTAVVSFAFPGGAVRFGRGHVATFAGSVGSSFVKVSGTLAHHLAATATRSGGFLDRVSSHLNGNLVPVKLEFVPVKWGMGGEVRKTVGPCSRPRFPLNRAQRFCPVAHNAM